VHSEPLVVEVSDCCGNGQVEPGEQCDSAFGQQGKSACSVDCSSRLSAKCASTQSAACAWCDEDSDCVQYVPTHCQQSVCDLATNLCYYPPMPGFCLLVGGNDTSARWTTLDARPEQCVMIAHRDPLNMCASCRPSLDPYAYSADDTQIVPHENLCAARLGCRGGELVEVEPALICEQPDPQSCHQALCDPQRGCHILPAPNGNVCPAGGDGVGDDDDAGDQPCQCVSGQCRCDISTRDKMHDTWFMLVIVLPISGGLLVMIALLCVYYPNRLHPKRDTVQRYYKAKEDMYQNRERYATNELNPLRPVGTTRLSSLPLTKND